MKKQKKIPFIKFIEDFRSNHCSSLINSEYWKEDFLESYGFVWIRWNINMHPDGIMRELSDYIKAKETRDRDGIFFVKVKEDRIRILCRSKENLDMWKKILLLRLSPTSKILVSSAGNICFDLDLTDIEKRILNENLATSRL